MAHDIIIEPSADLHLVLDFSSSKRNLKFRILERVWNEENCEFTLTDVSMICEYLLYPQGTSIFAVNSLNSMLTPLAKGTAFMVVRYNDNSISDPSTGNNHYLVVRVQVHQHLNQWWFGNNQVSINRLDRHETQVSVYADFDNDILGSSTSVVGDITGHGYINFSESDQSVFLVDENGRLLGLTIGNAQLHANFQNQSQSLDIRVRQEIVTEVSGNLCHPQPKLQPILQRILYNGPPAEKYNILFLTDGFTGDAIPDDDEGLAPKDFIEEAVHDLTSELFIAPRHSPFHLLKDRFNVWFAFSASEEGGITICPEIAQEADKKGYFAPLLMPYVSKDTNRSYYNLEELTEIVGLPQQTDLARFQKGNLQGSLASQQAYWRSLGLSHYDDNMVAVDVYSEWLKQVSLGILQAHDSCFGLRYGVRWGDRESSTDDGKPLSGKALQQRAYEWFKPQKPVRELSVDPRRFSTRHKDPRVQILRFVNTLADPLASPSDMPNYHVGQYWQPDWKPDWSKGQVSSRGLICIWIDDYLQGGSYNEMAAQTVRDRKGVQVTVDGKFLSRKLAWVKLDKRRMIDVLSHELGHAFNLGDEYEGSSTKGPASSNEYDNLTHISIIRDNSVQNPDPAKPEPVDDLKVKWFGLHRISRSDALVRDAEIRANGSWKLTLGSGRTSRWQKAMTDVTAVYLRKWKGQDGIQSRQLPFQFNELAVDLKITSIATDSSNTLVVEGLGLLNLTAFSAGSLLYIPETDKLGQPIFLVEETIRDRIAKDKRPSSSNHIATANHCGPSDDLPDLPFIDLSFIDNPTSYCNNQSYTPHLIGIYEGGDHYTCGVYRPAGVCKLRVATDSIRTSGRRAVSPNESLFCFVCRYLMVNMIDPSQHENLNKQYPGC